jgi:hypothetical protein
MPATSLVRPPTARCSFHCGSTQLGNGVQGSTVSTTESTRTVIVTRTAQRRRKADMAMAPWNSA